MNWKKLTFNQACKEFLELRAPSWASSSLNLYCCVARTISKWFGPSPLARIRLEHIEQYQAARQRAGKAAATINKEVHLALMVLHRAGLGQRFVDYHKIHAQTAPRGQALTNAEQQRLFASLRSRKEWSHAADAAVLAFFAGMRPGEIKNLRWADVDLPMATLTIRRAKTLAGQRSIQLNETCLLMLHDRIRAATRKAQPPAPDAYIFPARNRRRADDTKPSHGWYSSWRKACALAGLPGVRLHDGRHTAITTLAEAGIADWIIRAQAGHVDARMLNHYSHVRRDALQQAARALEPRNLNQQSLFPPASSLPIAPNGPPPPAAGQTSTLPPGAEPDGNTRKATSRPRKGPSLRRHPLRRVRRSGSDRLPGLDNRRRKNPRCTAKQTEQTRRKVVSNGHVERCTPGRTKRISDHFDPEATKDRAS